MFQLLDRELDARAYALARIIVGLASILITYESQQTLIRATSGDRLQIPAFDWVPTATGLTVDVVVGVALVAGIGMVVGVWPRVAAAALAAATAAVLLLEQQTYSNHLVLLGCMATLLALAQTDRAWTLVGRRPGTRVPFWPGFLIMALTSSVYFWTAISKINSQFLSGIIVDAMRPGVPIPDSVGPALAWVVIATELFLAIGLWSRRTRRAAFVVGAGLHLNIVLLLGNPAPLMPFAFLMYAGYVVFLAEDLDFEGPRTVVWDSHCSFCKRWVGFFGAIDLLRVHRFVGSADPGAFDDPRVTPDAALEALQLTSRLRHEQGFDAVRRVCEASPLTFWAAPLLGLRPVREAGHAVYRRVAARRTCKLPAPRT